MGATNGLALPIPELTDTADGPDAISDLANATEDYFFDRILPAGVVRYPTHHWGAGTAFPTAAAGVKAGDTYIHTALGRFLFNGTDWRQLGIHAVADETAIAALAITYGGVMHEGYRAYATATHREFEWYGSAFGQIVPGPGVGKSWDGDWGNAGGTAFANTATVSVPWATVNTANDSVRKETGDTIFTFLDDGVYAFAASVRFTAGGTANGERFVSAMLTPGVSSQTGTGILATGVLLTSGSQFVPAGGITTPTLNHPGKKVVAGQQLQIQVYQSSGAALTSSTANWSRLQITRIR